MDQTPHTCRTCSHWTPAPNRYWGAYAGHCADLHIVHSGERTAAHYGLSEEAYYQAQDHDELPDDDRTPRADELMFTAGDDWGGGFRTGPDFGCIHWTPTSPEKG